jgi:hypothetical protein
MPKSGINNTVNYPPVRYGRKNGSEPGLDLLFSQLERFSGKNIPVCADADTPLFYCKCRVQAVRVVSALPIQDGARYRLVTLKTKAVFVELCKIL